MSDLKELRIAFKGLSNGIHEFNFTVDDDFFKNFEKSSVKKGHFTILVRLERQEGMMQLQFGYDGWFEAPCDRCLSLIEVPLSFEDGIIIKFNEEESMTEEVMFIHPKKDFIELSELMYEMIHVHLPLQNLIDCDSQENNQCDQEAIKYLEYKPASGQIGDSVLKNLKS